MLCSVVCCPLIVICMCSSCRNTYVEGEKDDVGWARRIKHLQDGIHKRALAVTKNMYPNFDLEKSEALPVLECHASEVEDAADRNLYEGHDLYYARYWRANKFLGAMFANHKRINGLWRTPRPSSSQA